MNGIGIDIRVNRGEVQQARKDVHDLGKTIREINPTIDFGDPGANLKGAAGEMTRINQALARMKELTTAGDRNGNLLNNRQWSDMQRAMREVTSEFKNYGKEVEVAVNKVSHLNAQINRLRQQQKSGNWTSRDASKLSSLTGQRDEAQQHKKDVLAQEEKLIQAAARAEQYRSLLSGYGRAEEGRDGAGRTQRLAAGLQHIYERGSDRGGQVTRQERKEAESHYKRVTQEVARYRQELQQARKDVADLLREQRAGLRGGWGNEDKVASDEKIRQARARQAEVEQHRGRYDQIQQRSNQQMQGIGQFGTDNSGMAAGIKKALGWTLAAAGGFSILGFLSQSRAKYQQSTGHEATLSARGINGGYGDGIGMGIGPLQQMAMLENISQRAGMSGSRAQGAANLSGAFGRATGVDPEMVAGMYGTMYQHTGNADLGTGAIGMMGDAIKKGLDKARITELMTLVNRNTQVTASAMHGAGLDSAQAGSATALAIEALKASQDGKSYGQFAKSQEFAGVMQSGMQSAGTGAGDIRLFQAMGGFDGPMTWEKIHEMNLMRQGGFMENPEMLKKLIGGMSGSKEARAGQLETMFSAWGIKGKAADQMINMFDSGFLDKLSTATRGGKKSIESLKGGSKEEQAVYAEYQKQAASLNGMGKMAQEAKMEALELKAGQDLHEIFGRFKEGAINLGTALLDGNWKSAFKYFSDAVGGLGPAGLTLVGGMGLMQGAGIAMNVAAFNLNAAAAKLALGGALPGAAKTAGAGAAASRVLPWLFNPVTATAAGLGFIGWAGADNDKNLKSVQSNKELQDRYNQLQVMGNPNGPEGKRIASEMQRRQQGGAAAQPKPKGWYQHQDAISYSAQAYRVPLPLLAGLLESESDLKNVPMRTEHYANGKPFKVGGIAQFTESTAKARGVDPMNPASAIPGAAKYLRELYDETGSWEKAVERYKGIRSPSKMWQRDTAFEKAQKYTDQDNSASTTANTPQIDPRLLDVLTQIAINTAPMGQRPPAMAPAPSQ